MTGAPRFTLNATVLDSPDAQELADFYQNLLGWRRKADEPDWVMLVSPDGGAGLSFQTDHSYVRPVWPALQDDNQRMMAHLDIAVDDLEAAGARALELRAVKSLHHPHQGVQVYLDPAGHPFCLFPEEWVS